MRPFENCRWCGKPIRSWQRYVTYITPLVLFYHRRCDLERIRAYCMTHAPRDISEEIAARLEGA